MPLSIFSNRNRCASFAVMLCIGIALFALFYFLTLYLQNILGWSAIRTGVGFLPMTIGIIIAAGLTSQLVSKIGVRLPLIVGSGASVVGMLWITRITVTSSYLDILGPLVVIALGLGFVFVPLTLTAVSGVKPDEAGLASALLNTMQQVGGAIGLAVLATVAIDATNSEEHGVHHLTTHGEQYRDDARLHDRVLRLRGDYVHRLRDLGRGYSGAEGGARRQRSSRQSIRV